jgi:hypothetical protein
MLAAPAAWRRPYQRWQRIRPEVLLQKMPSSIVLLFGRNNAAASVTRVVKLGNNSVENLATCLLRSGVTYKKQRRPASKTRR